MTLTQLAEANSVDAPYATLIVDKLESHGLVERRPHPDDGRRKLVRLTPHGLAALGLSARVFDELRAEWSRQLGPDRLRALETDLRTMTPA